MITGAREKQLMEAANLLVNARRTHTPIADLPPDLQPTSIDEVARIHKEIILAYGEIDGWEIGGWKISAPSPDATPFFAPMPRAWMASGGAALSGPHYRYRGIEAEIAFLLGADLPSRLSQTGAAPYTREEVVAAIASCHPIIEELESGFIDPNAANKLSTLADLQMHGAFIYGPACADWKSIDFTKETVTLSINGAVQVERTGSNTSGDLIRLLPYLANEGAARTGGLRAGQWITTGSWTGNISALSGSTVEASFTRAGRVTLRFI